MSATLQVTEQQIESLATKLDGLDLSIEEQAALGAILGAGQEPSTGSGDGSGNWELPSAGEGLRNAFMAGRTDEVSGFGARSVDVSVSVGWSALH